jgi:ELWxxDGT repeat protein
MTIRTLLRVATALVSIALAVANKTEAATAHLLADLNPGTAGSYPSNFTAFNGSVLFSAYTLATGYELWKYDGTKVSLVADINPTVDDIGFGTKEGNDSFPTWLTPYKSAIYFSAYEPKRGDELWRYDGINVTRISDIAPDANDTIKIFPANSWPNQLTVVNDVLYFSATTRTNPQNYELWSYDGANVKLAANIHPDIGTNYSSYPTGLTPFNGQLYFMADDGSHGWELFRYNGTTATLIDTNPGGADSSSYPKYFTPFNNKLYFQAFTDAAGFELWRTDGTNTEIVSDLNPGAGSSYPQYMTVFNGELYFQGSDPIHGAELQRYNGTDVTLAADINPSGDSYPKNLTVFGNSLVFAADDGVHGWELWKFDGTTASLITDLNTSGDSFPEELTVVGNALYFTATTPDTGYEVWRYDGINVTLAADINPGPADSFPKLMKVIGNQLYFSATDDGSSNWEPWVIDESGTINFPPSIALTSPPNNAGYLTTDTITFSANASDDSAVTKVEFFANGTSIGTAMAAPYTISTTLAAGNYSITAKATDDSGQSTTTTPISITVNTPGNVPPTVTLTAPANDATFLTTDSITFSADASDDSAVTKVEFFANGNSIGIDTTAPYIITATLPAGTYSITATATDDAGVSSGSSPISIAVNPPANQPPTVALTAPTPGSTFLTTDTITFAADATDDSAVAKVEFFANGNLVGEDTTSPYAVTAKLAEGTYAISARATDNMGLSANADPITITVQAVTIGQPTIQSITQNAGSVRLQVTATDGATLALQGSADLVNWTQVDTATAVNGAATFTESISGAMQFYRVIAQ